MANLRVSIHIIGRITPGLLVNNGQVLSLSPIVETDLHQLQNRVNTILDKGSCELSLALVEELRRAELLPGWYEDWVLFERARLSHLRLHALLVTAKRSLQDHHNELALEAAAAALEIEPLYESAVEIAILAERASGNHIRAIRTYTSYEAYLRKNVGVAPSDEIRRTVADLL